jgi:hypothetical protein
MGLKSEPFRGVTLSGGDIGKFETQVKNHRPGKAAVATFRAGKKLAGELKKNGFVVYRAKRTAKAG